MDPGRSGLQLVVDFFDRLTVHESHTLLAQTDSLIQSMALNSPAGDKADPPGSANHQDPYTCTSVTIKYLMLDSQGDHNSDRHDVTEESQTSTGLHTQSTTALSPDVDTPQ